MDILESKLLPPHLKNQVPRPRLARKLSDVSGKRLILVTAGAGYGKTTLIAQALVPPSEEKNGRALVWLRLDRFDRDAFSFMAYLAHGLSRALPEFQGKLPGVFPGAGSPGQAEIWLLKFLKAVETVLYRETCIVLDDYHLLGGAAGGGGQGGPDVHACLDFLLERLPANLRLVIISRTEPPLKLSTLRVRRQVMEIHESDLEFTPEEAGALFLQAHGRDLAAADLAILHGKTRGWAAGLVLFAAALRGDGGPARILEAGGSRHHIFNFLEENIFETQTGSMQAFMMKTALMDPMEAEICNEVLDIRDSRARFRKMIAAHLMVFPMDGAETTFHYHHLYRDFLREKLQNHLGESEIRRLHLDIAGVLAARKSSLALLHYIDAGAYDEAAGFMEAFELEFLIQGKIFFVRTCLEKIPREVVEQNPRLLFMMAKQHSYFSRADRAIACLTSACRLFRQSRSEAHVAKCLVDLGAQYYYTGHIPEARGLMAEVLDTVTADPITYMLAATYLTFFCTVLGDLSSALEYEARARTVAEGFPEFERGAALAALNTSTTYIHYVRGDFRKSRELNLRLVSQCEADGLEAFLPLAFYHAAATEGMLGNFDQGLVYAGKGIRAAERIYLRDSQKGWLYMAEAECHLGLGRMAEARHSARTALDIFRQPGNRWGVANALELLARIRLAEDDVSSARTRISEALEIIRGHGLPMTEAILAVTRARVLMAAGNFEDACTCLAESRGGLGPAAFYLCLSRLLEARGSHALGRKREAWKHLEKGLAIAEEKGLDPFVLTEAGDLVRAAAASGPAGLSTPYLKELAARLEPERPGLRIRVLGTFRVFQGMRRISEADWTSSKALTLFQYLAVHRSAGFIPKEVLVEMLWPDQDPDRTGKRFNTAMSRLRKILEPDLPARAPSAYIRRRNDHYRLSLGEGGSLDLAEFRARAEDALKRVKKDPEAALIPGGEAVDLYGGPLLEDVLYQEWCIRLRRDLTALFCQTCRMMTDLYLRGSDPVSAVVYAEKCLQADPYDESMYLSLISLLLETGQANRARKIFMDCKERMAEIDSPLSPKILALHQKIMKNPLPV